jgi:hypothetical protein
MVRMIARLAVLVPDAGGRLDALHHAVFRGSCCPPVPHVRAYRCGHADIPAEQVLAD